MTAMKNTREVGLLHKIRAVKNSEENAIKINALSLISSPVSEELN